MNKFLLFVLALKVVVVVVVSTVTGDPASVFFNSHFDSSQNFNFLIRKNGNINK
jgi:hypothetical protein